jgi:hypothetical protein
LSSYSPRSKICSAENVSIGIFPSRTLSAVLDAHPVRMENATIAPIIPKRGPTPVMLHNLLFGFGRTHPPFTKLLAQKIPVQNAFGVF